MSGPDTPAVNPPNWENRTIFTGDNLEVLRRMNTGSVDLVYADPPWNSKKEWNAPIGSQAAGAGFKDTWRLSDIDLQWHDQLEVLNPALHDIIRAARGAGGDSTMSYLLMMSVRLLEMKRVMKPEASIYLHCDPTESHSLKLMMDTIFGRKSFQNEIIWGYNKPRPAKTRFVSNHDVILFYAGEEHSFNPQRVPTMDGKFEMRKPFKRPDGTWWEPKEPGKLAGSWWYDIPSFATRMTAKERTGYPTQKPLALLERIISASSNEGDVVLDPFCGCATTAVAAEELGRQWVGIDYSEKAVELVRERLEQRFREGKLDLYDFKVVHRISDKDHPLFVGPLERTDLGQLPPYKKHKPSLYVEQEGYCNLCGMWFEAGNLSVDHIIPEDDGGTDHKSNLQLLCRACNSKKGTRNWESVKADYFAGRRQRR